MLRNVNLAIKALKLERLCCVYEDYIPISVCADFLRITVLELSLIIVQARCPFAFCWKGNDKYHYRIPTMSFYNFIMQTRDFTPNPDDTSGSIKIGKIV